MQGFLSPNGMSTKQGLPWKLVVNHFPAFTRPEWRYNAQKTSLLEPLQSKQKLHIQVTLVIRAFAIRVFAYPRFYFSVMRSINILSVATF
jgi:hypothetical protein